MYYLTCRTANIGRKIITEEHPIVQRQLKNSDWDAEKVIKWLWGIEKKSDNILDLIEPGDLVKYKDSVMEVNKHNEILINCGTDFFEEWCINNPLNQQNIYELYKKNKDNVYDLVWKKD